MSDLFDGFRVSDVALFGQVVDVWMRPREPELERRRALRVEAIDDHDVIRALMTLPEGIEISPEEVGFDAMVVFDDMLRCGAVQETATGLIRRATPPVDLLGLAKAATGWTDVQAVTLLRTHAPRLVVVPERLARRVLKEMPPEVGVAVAVGEGTPRCLRTPGTRHVRPSWQRWASAEAVYRSWLNHAVSRESAARS